MLAIASSCYRPESRLYLSFQCYQGCENEKRVVILLQTQTATYVLTYRVQSLYFVLFLNKTFSAAHN